MNSNPINFIDPLGLSAMDNGGVGYGSGPGGLSVLSVVTEIRPDDLQAGMKSTHIITVDRASGELLSNDFHTGKTNALGFEFGSRGDDFSASVHRTGDSMEVRMSGETASKLFPLMINYDLGLSFEGSRGWTVTGTHDGYPSYTVTADGTVIYDYHQGFIAELGGCCDVVVRP